METHKGNKACENIEEQGQCVIVRNARREIFFEWATAAIFTADAPIGITIDRALKEPAFIKKLS